MDDWAITFDEIIDADAEAKSNNEETKTSKFNEKNTTYERQVLFILLTVLLITIAILIVVSNYCYVIKYQAKQKHILPFHVTYNKLKENMY